MFLAVLQLWNQLSRFQRNLIYLVVGVVAMLAIYYNFFALDPRSLPPSYQTDVEEAFRKTIEETKDVAPPLPPQREENQEEVRGVAGYQPD